MICPGCGAGNVPGEAFCDYCGTPLEAPVPTAQEVPELEPVSREAELEVTTVPAVPPAEEPAPLAEEPPTAEVEELTCPACGEAVTAGEAFCANCGATLVAAPPEPVAEDAPEPEPVLKPEPVAEEAVPVEPEPAPIAEEAPSEPEPAPEPALVTEVAPPEPEPAPAPAEATTCPACGSEVEAGDAFCSSCGFALQTAPAKAVPPEVPLAPAPAPAGLRLVVVDSGAEIPLPSGDEIVVGREDPVSGIYPDVDLTPHGGEEGGVSRQHARIVVEGGSYFVEDLDSTNFTFVNKQKLTPKVRQKVGDGDEIRFGRVTVLFRTGS